MRKNQSPKTRYPFRIAPLLAALLAAVTFFWWPRPLRSDNFVFYLSGTNEVLPARTIGKATYLPLLRVLNLVGKVDALKEGRGKLSVWFGATKLEFSPGSRRVLVGKNAVTLPNEVLQDDGQWLVPLDFLSFVLPRILSQPITYRPGDHRIFIGSTKPSTYSVRLEQIPNGARLNIDFSDPVTFQTAARNGKWILYLGNRPFEPLDQSIKFDNPYIRGLQFDDQDGVPKLILTPAATGLDMFPKIENGGKVLRADLVAPNSNPAEQAGTAQGEGSGPAAPQPQGQIPQVGGPSEIPLNPSLPVIVLDAGHGGSNLGAHGPNGLDEKDFTAQIVLRVRTSLLATGMYRVLLTRIGDTDPGFDQRALLASTSRAIAFVSFHAGDLGFRSPRVVVYTYQSSDQTSPQPQAPLPLFVPWATAQDFHLADSRRLAESLQQEFTHVSGLIAGKPEDAPVRVLQSVDAPAVAVELGSFTPEADPKTLLDPDFQRGLADAVARALVTFKRRPS